MKFSSTIYLQMNNPLRFLSVLLFLLAGSILLSSFESRNSNGPNEAFKMPYKKAGLTERQAAAHLLDRFSFGATPKQIDEVVKMGLENWFIQQLEGKINDDDLNDRLKEYDALNMSNEQIVKNFPRQPKILKEAIEEGFINKDSVDKNDKAAYREKLQEFMQQKGYRPEKELFRQFINHKILAAAYSNNQLQQILTEFWFNHFNVSITKNNCAQFIPAYERDVIRPHVTGKFYDLLLATAQSPAMLLFLDNFNSMGANDDMQKKIDKFQQSDAAQKSAGLEPEEMEQLKKINQNKKNQGLNENYAREIMELHTLGVDGGYTQEDVTQAARVLTGWTIFPYDEKGPGNFVRKVIARVGEENLAAKGFVHNGDFFFAINRHDTKEKKVLGKTFPQGGGYDEGLQLINLLAHHVSTSKFISKKLAVKFVSDNPPQSLVDKMAASFLKNDGDIKQILLTMVTAAEFWQKEALNEKTKSPFELAMSTVRALDANIEAPFMLYQWIDKMGQKMYYYQAPTGFPDRGQYWINTGSLLNRMNFGLAFASQKIPGISFSLAAINNNREPESAEAALTTYCKIIMPERDLAETIRRLKPMINDPSIQQKINEAAGKSSAANSMLQDENKMEDAMSGNKTGDKKIDEEKLAKKMLRKKGSGREVAMASSAGNNSMLAQVVGIILGSPAFQRK